MDRQITSQRNRLFTGVLRLPTLAQTQQADYFADSGRIGNRDALVYRRLPGDIIYPRRYIRIQDASKDWRVNAERRDWLKIPYLRRWSVGIPSCHPLYI